MNTLAVYNVKGGVGKTAAAVNLAQLAAASGLHVLLWDLDAQGAAGWYLHGEAPDASAKKILSGSTPVGRLVTSTPYPRLDLIPASFSYRYLDVLLKKVEPPREALKRLLKPFSEQYQLAVLDCPPSLSYLADNVLTAADLVLMPVVPTPLSLRAVSQLRDYCAEQGFSDKALRPFYSMVDRRRALHRTLLEAPPAEMKRALHSWIPYSAAVERMGLQRAPLAAFAGPTDPALVAYRALWEETRALLPRHK